MSNIGLRASNEKKGAALDYPIDIHIGAHRTGTSSFQVFLGLNGQAIRGAGFDLLYPARDGASDGELRLRLPMPKESPETRSRRLVRNARRLANARSGDARGMILSEENIPGRFAPFFKGQFYPEAPEKMKQMRQILPGQARRVLLVVRPYDELYVSAFRKRAEWRATGPFDRTIPSLMKIKRGWVRLAHAVLDGLQPQEMLIVPMAERGSNANLLRHLCPDVPDGLALQEPEERVNSSFTDAGLWALRAYYEANPDTKVDPEVRQQIAAQASSDDGPPFAAFTADQQSELAEKYAAELAELAEMDRVRIARRVD